jgi:antitoxin component YwqK of YwqJK toxin-antitoxin module
MLLLELAMRIKQIVTFIIIFTCFAFAVKAQQGFTNKAEAKNELVSGLKEGKWVEYLDVGSIVTKDTSVPYYRLTVYKAGKPFGIVREYHKGGKIASEIPYVEGRINGVEKWYYDNGALWLEIPYTNNTINGVQKAYFEDGKLNWETPYTGGIKNGVGKEYYANGKLKSETVYASDVAGATKNYDENGKEIK